MTLRHTFPFAAVRRVAATIFGFALLGATASHAQAHATASRKADVVVYAGYSFVQPDWGLAGTNDNGFIVGGTYSRYVMLFGREWGLGIDPRYTKVTGKTVNENAFTGNFQFQTKLMNKLRAYGTVGLGMGTINFNYLPDPADPNYTWDNGRILAGGAGLTYDVRKDIAIKADYQFQDWKLDEQHTINPSVFSFGVQYRLPFAKWISHGHESD